MDKRNGYVELVINMWIDLEHSFVVNDGTAKNPNYQSLNPKNQKKNHELMKLLRQKLKKLRFKHVGQLSAPFDFTQLKQNAGYMDSFPTLSNHVLKHNLRSDASFALTLEQARDKKLFEFKDGGRRALFCNVEKRLGKDFSSFIQEQRELMAGYVKDDFATVVHTTDLKYSSPKEMDEEKDSSTVILAIFRDLLKSIHGIEDEQYLDVHQGFMYTADTNVVQESHVDYKALFLHTCWEKAQEIALQQNAYFPFIAFPPFTQGHDVTNLEALY